MAARRRRSMRARGRAPGKSFWLRPPSFNLTERDNTNGVFSDLILVEADFQDPSAGLNDTKKGAPVLERIILDCGFAQIVNEDYFDPAGFG